MKLRGKKTGEIIELKIMQVNDKYLIDREVNYLNGEEITLKLLSDNFDDVEEPYIKDEEIRKIIRAWAKVNDATKLKYNYDENSLDDIYRNTITFNRGLGLKDGWEYTIAELCGEEDSDEA